MNVTRLMALALLGFAVIVGVAPEGPVSVVEVAPACELSQCLPPHDPICWGPHEDPTCI